MDQIILKLLDPAVLAGLTAVLGGIAAIISAWRNSKKIDENTALTRQAAVKAEEAKTTAASTTAELKIALNGRMDELVKAAYDRGVTDGQKINLNPGCPLKEKETP